MTFTTLPMRVWLPPLAAGVLAALSAGPARAVINPRFTPADLVRTSAQIVSLQVSAPENGRVAAEVLATLKGDAPSQKRLAFEIDENLDLTPGEVADAFAGEKTATAVLVLQDGDDEPSGGEPSGALQIGIRWFAVFRTQGKWRLAPDGQDLFAVWAGSAENLVEATRYVLADPAAGFPVRSEIAWKSEMRLGKLSGGANGCLAADLGEPIGLCVLVPSDGGDRVYRAAAGDAPPADVTQKVRLDTASKLAVPGDFNGDERIDLACWEGETLALAVQNAEGAFDVRSTGVKLSDCRSLDAFDVGKSGRAGLLAGTSNGPVLLAPGDADSFTARPLVPDTVRPAPSGLGPGGLCVAADFDADGRCDVVEVFPGGTLFYAGQSPGQFKAPIETAVRVVVNPSSAACGDYDADGRLDLVVGGEDGVALLSGDGGGRFSNVIGDTGELAYHGNMNRPAVIGCAPCDVNNDGRQSVALFGPGRCPMLFFNRGFACFGWARELDVGQTGGVPAESVDPLDPFGDPSGAGPPLQAAKALQQGQTAGMILDLSGDGIQDMVAVDRGGNVWALFGGRDAGRALSATIALAPRAPGPVTVTVREKDRCLGMYVVRPGVPALVGREQPGPLNLQWKTPGGEKKTRRVIVIKPTRTEIGD